MLEAAAAATPSASMLNSSLAHQHRQKSLLGGGWVPFPLDLKTGFWKAWRGGGGKISLLHLVSLQRSEVIAEVKPNETDSPPARRRQAEIKGGAGPRRSAFQRGTTQNSLVSEPGRDKLDETSLCRSEESDDDAINTREFTQSGVCLQGNGGRSRFGQLGPWFVVVFTLPPSVPAKRRGARRIATTTAASPSHAQTER